MTKSIEDKLHLLPNNSWESFQPQINDAIKNMKEILSDKPMGMWLDKVLHNMIWHEGDCVIRWINENKELAAKINAAKNGDEFSILRDELDLSVRKLNKLGNRK